MLPVALLGVFDIQSIEYLEGEQFDFFGIVTAYIQNSTRLKFVSE